MDGLVRRMLDALTGAEKAATLDVPERAGQYPNELIDVRFDSHVGLADESPSADAFDLGKNVFRGAPVRVVVNDDVGPFARGFQGNFGAQSDACPRHQNNFALQFHRMFSDLEMTPIDRKALFKARKGNVPQYTLQALIRSCTGNFGILVAQNLYPNSSISATCLVRACLVRAQLTQRIPLHNP